jgi:hypothetical protein
MYCRSDECTLDTLKNALCRHDWSRVSVRREAGDAVDLVASLMYIISQYCAATTTCPGKRNYPR